EQRKYEQDDEDRQEDPEENDGDAGGTSRQPGKAQRSGDQRNDEKDKSPLKHTGSAPSGDAQRIAKPELMCFRASSPSGFHRRIPAAKPAGYLHWDNRI